MNLAAGLLTPLPPPGPGSRSHRPSAGAFSPPSSLQASARVKVGMHHIQVTFKYWQKDGLNMNLGVIIFDQDYSEGCLTRIGLDQCVLLFVVLAFH